MNHDRVCLFRDGSWCWFEEFTFKGYGHLGAYKEIVLGQGWHDRDVSNMLKAYFEENFDNLF